VTELLLCGGCRPGAPGDFDSYRDVLGSAELPAQMQYLVRARRTDGGKEHIFGENHRIARRENIPAFLWFERTEDDDSLSGVGSVYMPVHATYDPRLFVRDERGLRGPGIPPALRAWLKGEGDLWIPCGLWWLDEVAPLESDAPDLLDFARWAFGPGGDEYSRCAAVRALGRVRDAASERFLREVAARSWPKRSPYIDEKLPAFANASLARRGHPVPLADLLASDDFALLLEASPGFAVARLRERLVDPSRVDEACELLRTGLDDTHYGIRFEETLFAGIAEAAIASELGGHVLARIAVTVPGCRRAALADAAFRRLDPRQWLPEDEEARIEPDIEAAAFLHSADPGRFVAALRRWSEDADARVRALALRMLVRIGDEASAGKLVATVDEWRDDWHGLDLLARVRSKEVERFLAERAGDGDEEALDVLVACLGLQWLYPESTLEILERIRKGEAVPHLLEALEHAEERNFYPELGLVKDPRVLEWLRKHRRTGIFEYGDVLRALVLAGDRDAKDELWSMVRCGRHRLLYGSFDERVFTLDWDFSTLPHWILELDSNCCRVAGGLESIFEDYLGTRWLYGRPSSGLGEPRSRRVRTELLWHGGTYVWSPLVDRFVAKPD